MVDQETGRKRADEIGQGRAYRQPAKHLAQLQCTVGSTANMALQGNHRAAGGAAGQQSSQTQHRKHRKSNGRTGANHCGDDAKAHRSLEPVTVSVTARGQSQKNLGERKKRQQNTHGRRTVTLSQGQQRRGHAGAGHAGRQTEVSQDEARECRAHACIGLRSS